MLVVRVTPVSFLFFLHPNPHIVGAIKDWLLQSHTDSTYTPCFWWQQQGRWRRPRPLARRRKCQWRRRTSGPWARSSSSPDGTWRGRLKSRGPAHLRGRRKLVSAQTRSTSGRHRFNFTQNILMFWSLLKPHMTLRVLNHQNCCTQKPLHYLKTRETVK